MDKQEVQRQTAGLLQKETEGQNRERETEPHWQVPLKGLASIKHNRPDRGFYPAFGGGDSETAADTGVLLDRNQSSRETIKNESCNS